MPSTSVLVIFLPTNFQSTQMSSANIKLPLHWEFPFIKLRPATPFNGVWGSVLMFLSRYSSLNLSHSLESCLRVDHGQESPDSPHLVQTSAPVVALWPWGAGLTWLALMTQCLLCDFPLFLCPCLMSLFSSNLKLNKVGLSWKNFQNKLRAWQCKWTIE